MMTFATFYNLDEAHALETVLNERQIPFEKRVSTEDSGIETIELLATEHFYDAACDVTEQFQKAAVARQQERSGRCCPKCGSKHLELVEHEKLTWVTQCKDCGCLIAR